MSDLGKVIPFQARRLSARSAALEDGRSHGITDWALVDQKTRKDRNKEFPASSVLAHLRAVVVNKLKK
jgi:hypothetical protein